jgi:hypothetical protein
MGAMRGHRSVVADHARRGQYRLAGTMGLLDDAIREHMELKRLRGADPAVIAQQEHDALGPVLREEDLEGDVTEEDVTDAVAPAAPHVAGATPNAGNAARQAPDDDSSEPPQPDHAPDFANVGQETAELDMRTVLDEQHEAADRAGQIDSAGLAVAPEESGEPVEDVLEETPDFLRDTPEQERLWFEQQPPRDFDFDK